MTPPSSSQGKIQMGGWSSVNDMINKSRVTLAISDVDDIITFVPNIQDATISFNTRSTVTGGELDEETTYTIAGVEPNYLSMSNLSLVAGAFVTEWNNENKEKICILGSNIAIEIFGSVMDAYDSTIYINEKPYIINGILDSIGTVASGISPDDSIFIPYNTGIKYMVGLMLY